jgi:ribosome-binding factor A
MRKVKEEKFARFIQKELGYIFLQHVKFTSRETYTSVTKVIASPDKGYVKVYLSFLNEKEPLKALEEIKIYTKEIRSALAQRIRNQVRKIPEISFFYDDTMDYIEKMDNIFKKLNDGTKQSEEPKEAGK